MLKPTRTVTTSPSATYPLHVSAKCYRPQGSSEEGITLVLLHGVGSYKEVFEPTIAELFALHIEHETQRKPKAKIYEVWSIDCPNHGQSAILNEDILRTPEWNGKVSAEEYAKAACAILTSASRDGVGIDFSNRIVMGAGHSMGGVCLVHLANMLPFFALLVVDPPWFIPARHPGLVHVRDKLLAMAYERKDTWPSLDAAEKHMRSRTPRWSEDAHRLYAKYALRPHPASSYGIPYYGVVTCCTREQEAPMYDGVAEATDEDLDILCKRIPVHLVLAGVPDLVPRVVQTSIVRPRSKLLASVTWMKDVGHFIPQEAPRELAKVIDEKLVQLETTITRSRL